MTITMKKETGNDIGGSGVRMISESLKTNTTLTALNLGNEMKEKRNDKSIVMKMIEFERMIMKKQGEVERSWNDMMI